MDSVDTLSSAAWHGLSSEEKFRRYLGVLGLPVQGNRDRVRQRLDREYPAAWKEFRAVAKRRDEGDMRDDVYALKNQGLQFSLLVTAAERGELHAKAFSTVENIAEPISSILDVGCENGLLTCLWALRWPNAQVIGLDPSGPALDRARELASRLKLKNVRFVAGTAEDIPRDLGADVFDLITTVTVLHDGNLFPPVVALARRTDDLFTSMDISPLPPAFVAIAALLAPSKGRWVAMERCQSPKTFSGWCQAVGLAGLGINWKESGRIPCEGEFLTVVVAGHDQPKPLDLRKVQGLWMSPEFNRWTLPGEPPWSVRNQQAEALFAQLNPKTCIDRIVALAADGREVQRAEVWEADTLALLYIAIHPAAQTHLQLRAITDLSAMRDHWKTTAAGFRKNAPLEAQFEEFHLNA